MFEFEARSAWYSVELKKNVSAWYRVELKKNVSAWSEKNCYSYIPRMRVNLQWKHLECMHGHGERISNRDELRLAIYSELEK